MVRVVALNISNNCEIVKDLKLSRSINPYVVDNVMVYEDTSMNAVRAALIELTNNNC